MISHPDAIGLGRISLFLSARHASPLVVLEKCPKRQPTVAGLARVQRGPEEGAFVYGVQTRTSSTTILWMASFVQLSSEFSSKLAIAPSEQKSTIYFFTTIHSVCKVTLQWHHAQIANVPN
jgi:hypothetical protein